MKYLTRISTLLFLMSLAFALGLQGCTQSHIRPKVYRSSKAAPKPIVYSQCDKDGCRKYDRYGHRRYDLERP